MRSSCSSSESSRRSTRSISPSPSAALSSASTTSRRCSKDYRFLPAVEHVGLYLLVWLAALIVLVVLLAIVVHAIGVRWLSAGVRFLYYIPGALAGASSVMLWLFVLDPTVSPVSFVLHGLGFEFVRRVGAGRPAPGRPRGHRVLDRCGRLDRRDVRRAEQHQPRRDRGRSRRWRRPDQDGLVDSDPAAAEVDRLHGRSFPSPAAPSSSSSRACCRRRAGASCRRTIR